MGGIPTRESQRGCKKGVRCIKRGEGFSNKNRSNKKKLIKKHTTHEILQVKDCARKTTEFIVVRNSGSKSIITKYGGRKFYANRNNANLAIGNNEKSNINKPLNYRNFGM